MPCYYYRCPRCGRYGNRIQEPPNRRYPSPPDTPVGPSVGDSAVSFREPNAGCACSSAAAELYGIPCNPTPLPPPANTCCDNYNGCHRYYSPSRDPYWPDFCHPRWLRCDQLYRNGR